MSLAVALVILLALIIYLNSGGADFGSGVWELLSSGPRAEQQRAALRRAIAPIWEAHHVWLIVVVVLLFVCFPPAFTYMMITLHVPLTLLLIGIVLRGAAFAFRSYSAGARSVEVTWTRVFTISSTITPVMLGLIAGAIASGELPEPVAGMELSDYFAPWLAPFPFAIGFLTLALCSYLAASYMTTEVDEPALRDDFRRRALWSGAVTTAGAVIALFLARWGAPALHDGLLHSWWSVPLLLVAALSAGVALWSLLRRRWRLAQIAAIAQAGLVLVGWAAAQAPYLVAPALTVEEAAAPEHIIAACLWVLGLGSLLVVPGFVYLYVIFKRRGGPPEGEASDEDWKTHA